MRQCSENDRHIVHQEMNWILKWRYTDDMCPEDCHIREDIRRTPKAVPKEWTYQNGDYFADEHQTIVWSCVINGPQNMILILTIMLDDKVKNAVFRRE